MMRLSYPIFISKLSNHWLARASCPQHQDLGVSVLPDDAVQALNLWCLLTPLGAHFQDRSSANELGCLKIYCP